MKAILLILLIPFLTSFSTNAKPSEAARKKPVKTIISGTVDKNWDGDVVKFVVKDFASLETSLSGNVSLRDSVKIVDGKFQFSFYISNPVYAAPEYDVWATIPAYQVFNVLSTRYVSAGMLIEPGDSIVISNLKKGVPDNHGYKLFDKGSYFTEQTYSGRGAEKLWCIQNIIKNSQLYNYPKLERVKMENFQIMQEFSDSVTTMILNTMDIYKHKLSPTANAIIKAHYIPMFAEDISEIIHYSKLDTKIPANKALIRARIAESEKIVNVRDPGVEYGVFFVGILQKRALLQYAMDNDLDLSEISNSKYKFSFDLYNALKQNIPDSPIKRRVIASFVYTGLKTAGLDGDAETIVKDFLNSNPSNNPFYVDVKAYYEKIELNFSKGIAAYNFVLPDTTGKLISLNDFKGKLVLIDFMFTGCGGCIQMVPALKKIEEKYSENSNIVFISISDSPDIKGSGGWRAGIGRYSVKSSIQLCAGGKAKKDDSNRQVIKEYNVLSFPQLVLVGRNGRLITTRVLRPDVDNGKSLMELIEKSLSAVN